MAIALDNKQHYSTTTTQSTYSTSSFTVTGSNMYGIAFVASYDATNTNDPTGVTWNGVAMTKLTSATHGGRVAAQAWGIVSPGTGVITATWGANVTVECILAITYSGVKQSGQPDANNAHSSSNEGSSTTIALAVTTVAANAEVISAEFSATNTIVPTVSPHTMELSDAAQTLLGGYAADNLQVTAGTNTATWTCGGSWGSNWQFASDVILSVSLSPALAQDVNYLIIAGGGGGGSRDNGGIAGGGGGGGAGGYKESIYSASPGTYPIVVGGGGAGGTAPGASGTDGSNSSALGITSTGGGGGGPSNNGSVLGRNGGSAGGGGYNNNAGGTASPAGQGNNGGKGSFNIGPGGGGGGANAVGSDAPGTQIGGAGGNGKASSITGSTVTRAGGGGGGSHNSGTASLGGSGGGGNGGYNSGNPTDGTANTGGGGGGQDWFSVGTTAGGGGSGVVILSYTTTDFGTCTGGTKTTNGSKTVHTFTSNDNFVVVAASTSNGNMFLVM